MLSKQKDSALEWPEALPHAIYDLRVPEIPSGRPLALGEEFHAALEAHLSGCWVSKDHYYSCSAIAEILSDMGLERKTIQTELPLQRGGLVGIADVVGYDSAGKPWVIEIKTTQGQYAFAPSSTEFCQLALYANLLDTTDSTLACIRINFARGNVSVFRANQTDTLAAQLKVSVESLYAA